MKTSILLTLLLPLSMLISCDKNDNMNNEDFDYLIFGHYYGECGGEGCIETFKLSHEKLYEDQNDHYNGDDFDFIELGNEKFEDVKDLTDFIPDDMLEESELKYGCPDCYDQGGLRITYSEDGQVISLRLDQSKNDVPEYLHDFMDKVNEKIALLNN